MLKRDRPGRNNPYALWIRSLVDNHNWTFERLAVELGASFGSVKNWYHGWTIPLKAYRKPIEELYQAQEKKERRI